MPSFGSNAQVEFEIAAPPRLPRNRPRALTYPLPVEPDDPQRTCDQSKSALISLPFELRRQIWIEVLSGHLLHITRDAKRLVAIDCTVKNDKTKAEFETRRHGCWGVTDWSPHMDYWWMPGCYQRPRDGHPARPANLLPLLQTCRLIYTETVSMLYEDNIFDFNHTNMLIYLECYVLPKRLNQIRVLNLTWGITYPPVPQDAYT